MSLSWSSSSGSLKFLDVFTDSDWAGDVTTRKSTSGGIISWGGSLIKSWSKCQSIIPTSSGEAELYALSRGVAEGLGVRALLKDLVVDVQLRVWTDSSAAKSVTARKGLGKLRHVDTQYLWVQEVVARGLAVVR